VPAIGEGLYVRRLADRRGVSSAGDAPALCSRRSRGQEVPMRSRWLVVGLLAVVALGCEDRRKKAIEQVGHDEAILKEVNGAVNEVIRNTTDCDAAKPLMVEAYQKIDAARPQLTSPATGQTLDALKAQVDRVKQVCP
jgi:hypothetical protein